MRLPDFFIVGHGKSGTTALYHYLGDHPEIFVPRLRIEPHYFCTDLHCPQWHVVTKLKDYGKLFRGAELAKRVGEKSPSYLYSRCAAKEIQRWCPSADIIVMLRNPVDMLHSSHSQLVYNGDEDIEDFEEALGAEADRKENRRIPVNMRLAVSMLYYSERIKYAEQVKRYLDVFGREKVRIIVYDDFKDDVAGVYREILQFLGVDPHFKPNFDVINPNKVVRSRRFRDLTRHPPAWFETAVKAVMPRPILYRVQAIVEGWNTKYRRRPPMDGALRTRLQLQFRDEVQELSELIERDLTHWCIPDGGLPGCTTGTK